MSLKIEQYDIQWNFANDFDGELRHVTADEVCAKMNNGRLIEGAFAQDLSIRQIELPKNLVDIGEVAFFGCKNLSEITFPQGLKCIREEAFGESGVEHIVIPDSVELVGEKAFLDCPRLESVDVLGAHTFIEVDAFGTCPRLLEGYIACGYPSKTNPPEELFYTLLWSTCPQKHTEATSKRAKNFILNNIALVMERIFKFNNVAALRGIVSEGLLAGVNLQDYISQASNNGMAEISTMLLSASRQSINEDSSAIDDIFAL